jgi:hypothetical protein
MQFMKRFGRQVFLLIAAAAVLLSASPSDAGVRYTYDANNRLIQVVDMAGDASKSYVYDKVGNRLETGYGLYLSASPMSHDFGTVLNSTQSSPQTFTVTNRMDIEIPVNVAHIGNGRFVILSDTCSDITLAPSATCTVEVVFDPGRNDSVESDQMELHSDYTTGAFLYVPLRGRSGEPNIGSTENSLDFGDVAIGDTSAAQTVTLQNNAGTYPLEISSVGLTGDDAGNFTITSDTCTEQQLAPDVDSCTVDVAAAPKYNHTSIADLSVVSNADPYHEGRPWSWLHQRVPS